MILREETKRIDMRQKRLNVRGTVESVFMPGYYCWLTVVIHVKLNRIKLVSN